MNGGQNTVTWKICDEIQSNCKTARTRILNKKHIHIGKIQVRILNIYIYYLSTYSIPNQGF